MIIFIVIKYNSAATYVTTLTVDIPFEETYRYIPEAKYKLNNMIIKVVGALDKGKIFLAKDLKALFIENITDKYKDSLIMQESQTFKIPETNLKRCPITKDPTVENLSIMFFNKMSPILKKEKISLVSVTLISEDISSSYSKN